MGMLVMQLKYGSAKVHALLYQEIRTMEYGRYRKLCLLLGPTKEQLCSALWMKTSSLSYGAFVIGLAIRNPRG